MASDTKPKFSDDSSKAIWNAESTLRKSLTDHNAAAAAEASAALFNQFRATKNPAAAYGQVEDADIASSAKPLILYDGSSEPLKLRPDVQEQLTQLEQDRKAFLRTPEGKDEMKKSMATDAIALSQTWAHQIDGPNRDAFGIGHVSDDQDQSSPQSVALSNFKRHLRDAFNVGDQPGVDRYISGTTEQLRKLKCYLLIERGTTTAASSFDPPPPGEYGAINLRAADGSKAEFHY